MSIRVTGLLALALLVLTGYYYFFEVRHADVRARSELLSRLALPAAASELTALTLFDGRTAVALVRRDDGWWVVAPVDTPADPGEVETVVHGLSGLVRLGTVADSARIAAGEARLADFGLGGSPAYAAVTAADGRRDTLFWGDRSPTGEYFYGKRASAPDVMTMRQTSGSLLDRGLLRLRDRRVVPIQPDSVRRIEIAYGDTVVAVSHASGSWTLERPVKELADVQAVDRLVRRLSTAKAIRIAAERARPGTHGTDRPRLRITVDQGPGLGTQHLLVGDRVAGGGPPAFFSVNPDLAPLFVVDAPVVRDLKASASDLRYKQIFGFELAGIDRVRLEQGGRAIECRRDSSAGHWLVTEPRLQVVLDATVEMFIDRVDRLSAKAFVADRLSAPARWGMDPPRARIALWRGPSLVREVQIGHVNRRIYAKADHRPEVVELEPREARLLNLELIPVKPDSVAAGTRPEADRASAAGR